MNQAQARVYLRHIVELAIKTVNYFDRVLRSNVRDLYNGEIGEREFVDSLAGLLEQQLIRAWNEGMRQNGLDPAKDMTPEFDAALQNIIANEYNYVDQYAADILSAAQAGDPIQPYLDRAGLWANRYQDVVNQAALETAQKGDRLVWRLGATEEHCETCARLDGIIATKEVWEASGYKPQSPPNDMLECGGWRCDCRLEYTEDAITEDQP